MEALASSASTIGIDLTLAQQPYTTLTTAMYSCVAATHVGCGWQLDADLGWVYYGYPSGDQVFQAGATGNAGGYSNAKANRLIRDTLTGSGLGAMFNYENYLAQQVPVIYLPTPPYQITVYKTVLHGVTPQDPSLNIYPETYTVGS
jgi:peptide/nickel transport system substrate-binding protein